MKQIFKPLVLLMFLSMTVSYAADNLLQNPNFENVTVNGTSHFSLLDRASSSIPGWSFAGTVYYVTSSNDSSSFPANGGHAIQLAENGRINQTLRVRGIDEVLDYVLSFNLAALNEDCAGDYNRTIAVNVTAYQTSVFENSRVLRSERSKVFFYYGRNFSSRLWESNAFSIWQMGKGDYVNLEIKSHVTDDDRNVTSTCWPLVDAFIVKRNHLQRYYNGSSLANGDFEVGPSFLKNSYEGILLNQEEKTYRGFPLQDWDVIGTIRYIDSKHYKVPHGKAAIELLSESGVPSGIQIDLYLRLASTYTLNFTMGDANDSCVGDLVLLLEIGQNVQNYTMSSHGTGSAFRHSVTINGEPSSTTTSTLRFYSVNETRTRSDGVLCGPVLDEIGIFGSYDESVIKENNGVMLEMVDVHFFVAAAALSYFIFA